jgi:hypothetical protein
MTQPKQRKASRYCQQPDRDEPALVCGYPLPCPHHTVVIDVSGDQPRVEIPEHADAAVRQVDKLGKVARALHEPALPKTGRYEYSYSRDQRTVVIEHDGSPCLVMSAEIFEWLRSLPPIKV